MGRITRAGQLALHGRYPFRPDIQVYAGGFQGPLYPNPTTLILPDKDPIPFQIDKPTAYTMNKYTGLSEFNPGINYRNPGHLLGLLDTFSRMAYGLHIMEGMTIGEDNNSPLIPIELPDMIKTLDLGQGKTSRELETLSSIDIYPAFAELPGDYADLLPFIGGEHTPSVASIDFGLFGEWWTESYRLTVAKFRELLNTLLSTFISTRTFNITTNIDPSDFLEDLDPVNSIDFIAPPGGSRSINGNQFAGLTVNNDIIFSYSTVLASVGQALKMINGTDEAVFHGNATETGQLDYRSLTELNAVTNLVPIQGYLYRGIWRADDPPSTFVIHQMLVGWLNGNLNIVNLTGQTEQVRIHGNIKIEIGNGENISALDIGTVFMGKDMAIFMRVTNEFCWDRTWFNLPLRNKEFIDTSFDQDFGASDGAGGWRIPTELAIPPPSSIDLELTFDETMDIGLGCNNIIVQALGQWTVNVFLAFNPIITMNLNIEARGETFTKNLTISI